MTIPLRTKILCTYLECQADINVLIYSTVLCTDLLVHATRVPASIHLDARLSTPNHTLSKRPPAFCHALATLEVTHTPDRPPTSVSNLSSVLPGQARLRRLRLQSPVSHSAADTQQPNPGMNCTALHVLPCLALPCLVTISACHSLSCPLNPYGFIPFGSGKPPPCLSRVC